MCKFCLIHLDDAGQLCRSSLNVELPFGAPKNAFETLGRVLSNLSFFRCGTNAHGKFMQVTHRSYAINPDFVPLQRCRTLVREHMLAGLTAVLPKTIFQFPVFPAIDAAAFRASEASLPAF